MREQTVDLIVVGSGGGGLTAALTAHAAGLRPLVLEKTARVGGTTALSGGLFWVGANPLMREAGIEDDPEATLEYLEALSSDRGEPQARARREAFARAGGPMVELLRGLGLEVDACTTYPDYYPEAPGGRLGGRPLEPRPFDLRRLGTWQDSVRPQSTLPRKLRMRSSEFADATLGLRTATGAATLGRVAARSARAYAQRVPLAVGGEALIARLLELALKRDIPIWTETRVQDLRLEGDRVVGVQARRGSTEISLRSRHGVVLACAGFARDPELRSRYARQPTSVEWTKASEGETGDLLRAAIDLGAAVARMQDAWYVPMSILPDGALAPHHLERSRPGSIIVDSHGQRFVNEAANYNHVGQEFYARDARVPAIPSWLVIDSTHRRRYPFFTAVPGRTPRAWLRSGYMKRAATLAELAAACELPVDAFETSVRRFNAFARAGRDEDFGRGDSAYDRYMGDPSVRPNPCLGPVASPPFSAVRIYPGDLGTCGGLVTSEHAEVVRTGGTAVPGLFAAGNVAAPLVPGAYWGAGTSIGASMTSGYIAGRAASRESTDRSARSAMVTPSPPPP